MNTVRCSTKQMQHRKSHEDYSDATACAQAQPCIAYPPENPTEDTILTPILLNLIPAERIPFSFREKIWVKIDYVALTWTIFLPNAVRKCPKSLVSKNLVIFTLLFMCGYIILALDLMGYFGIHHTHLCVSLVLWVKLGFISSCKSLNHQQLKIQKAQLAAITSCKYLCALLSQRGTEWLSVIKGGYQ